MRARRRSRASSRRRWRLPARGQARVRRRPGAAREVLLERPRHVEVQVFADTHGNCRAPLRARLLGAAPPPEDHRGSARARHDARAARRDGRGGGRCGAGGRLRRAPARSSSSLDAGGQLLLHGDEHAPAGRASGDRDDHRPRPGRMAAARRGRRAAAAARRSEIAVDGHAIEARLYAEDPAGASCRRSAGCAPCSCRAESTTCASTPASRRATQITPLLRPDDRQGDRLGRRPAGGAGADARRRCEVHAGRGVDHQSRLPARRWRSAGVPRERTRHRLDRPRGHAAACRRAAGGPADAGCSPRWPTAGAEPRPAGAGGQCRAPTGPRPGTARRLAAQRSRRAGCVRLLRRQGRCTIVTVERHRRALHRATLGAERAARPLRRRRRRGSGSRATAGAAASRPPSSATR